MLNKFITLILIFLFNFNTSANPAPLGVEINKSTLSDVRKLYKIVDSAPNATKGYYSNLLDIKNVEVKNLNQLTMINDLNEIIVGISFSIYKNEFEEVFNVLNKKYKLIRSEIPYVGNKYVEFQDNNCLITIDSPHMSEFMDVGYHDLNFLNKVASRIKQKQQDQEQQNNKNF